MEYVKNIILSPDFISLFIINGTLIAIIYIVIKRNRTKKKFYEAVLSGDYTTLLHFLMITDTSTQKRICYPYYIKYVERGLYEHFNSRLNVRVTSSRVTILKQFFTLLEEGIKDKPIPKKELCRKTITAELSKVIYACGPHYFAGCYVDSLSDKKDEEAETRLFVEDVYNSYANSQNEKSHNQFTTFIDLVNKEIDERLKWNIPEETKDFLKTQKISVGKNIMSTTKFYVNKSA